MADHAEPRRPLRDHVAAMVEACGRRRIVALLAVQVGAVLAEAAALALLVPVIGVISGADRVGVPLLGRVEPWVALALIAGAVVVRAGLQWASAVAANEVRMRTSDHLRLKALRALFLARWGFVAAQRRSHVVQSLTTEAQRTLAATDTLIQSGVSLLVLVAISVVILTVSPALGGVALIGVLVVVAASRPSVTRSARLGEVAGERIDDFGGAVTDSLTAARVIRAHDAQERWLQLAAAEAGRARAALGAYVRTTAAVRVVMGVLSVGAAVVLVVLGRLLELDTAQVIALGVLALRLVTATQSLVSQWQYFANLAPALAKVSGLARAAGADAETPAGQRAHSPATTTGVGDGRTATGGAPLLELRDVAVRYPGAAAAAVEHVDLRLARGLLTVVSGPSGAGKSTVLDVVLGLRRPSSGVVLVEGRPLDDLAAWRSRIGYVPQEGVLVPGTVRDNLTWSLQEGRTATDEELWSALDDAGLTSVVRALPDGLSTWLGETAELSGGEKQRLSIARALVRRPDLLVLDEATSALDERTEEELLAGLRRAHRTTIFVSHRPQVLTAADVVVRMDRGRLAATRDQAPTSSVDP